ncbi:MAG: polysaccharide deacetylase family protein [Bacteroidia bacterium]|jgi:peptidoglycan/xylan/chitin deacetylase (PgdA/CDA1 family)|nr:polysaccharide deacetylase family protein [Bacteroidia bacterium]
MNTLVRPPRLLQQVYPGALWRMPGRQKIIYLTFDDGPVPGVTTGALAVLAQFGVKATFFCVGDNVQKHPEVFAQLVAGGHRIGNHTFNHLDGWKHPRMAYLRNVQQCAGCVDSNLFRPPYGRMRPSQHHAIRKQYKVVMWDVLSCDFDPGLTGDACLEMTLLYSRPGSIVVFHDSLKAAPRMLYALPRYIETMLNDGWEFGVL